MVEPRPVQIVWLGFPPGMPELDAVSAFVARYGIRPPEIRRTGGALLLGPLPRKEEGL